VRGSDVDSEKDAAKGERRQRKCGFCHVTGHNRANCPKRPREKDAEDATGEAYEEDSTAEAERPTRRGENRGKTGHIASMCPKRRKRH